MVVLGFGRRVGGNGRVVLRRWCVRAPLLTVCYVPQLYTVDHSLFPSSFLAVDWKNGTRAITPMPKP